MPIETLVRDYVPTQEIIEDVQALPLTLFVGITGAGKDTLQTELMKLGEYEKIITSTTRAPRLNNGVLEKDGKDYYFFSLPEAEEMIKLHHYFEVAYVHGRINGATSAEISRLRASGKPVIGDVDYQGAAYYRKYAPQTKTVFLIPARYDQWEERVRKRYATPQEFDDEWRVRRESAVIEIERALADEQYHFIVNNQISISIQECLKVIKGDQFNDQNDTKARAVASDLLKEIKSKL